VLNLRYLVIWNSVKYSIRPPQHGSFPFSAEATNSTNGHQPSRSKSGKQVRIYNTNNSIDASWVIFARSINFFFYNFNKYKYISSTKISYPKLSYTSVRLLETFTVEISSKSFKMFGKGRKAEERKQNKKIL
jgi:hypothetical protein